MSSAVSTPGFPEFISRPIACPACDRATTEEFYSVPAIPIHSCLLMNSREQALEFSTADLTLSFCPTCGFIFNSQFDPDVRAYGASYEETQGFSPTFSRYAQRLAARLVAQYDLRGRRILEIGCGKGDFLLLLAREGESIGFGVDPAYVPGRLPDDANQRCRFYRDYFAPEHAELEPDFICCRHTLEHIPYVQKLLAMVHEIAAAQENTTVWFDLPDVLRVLTEGAYWDIYYEHCSYFTAGSLARLFRRAGFGLVELGREYDDQWVAIGAKTPADTGTRFELEDDLQAITAAAHTFREHCRERIEHWTSVISRVRESGGKSVIWGAGSKGVAFLTTLGLFEDAIPFCVDINPYKQARYMPTTGQEVIAPDGLREVRPTDVIVMNPIYLDEIRAQLSALGLIPNVLPIV